MLNYQRVVSPQRFFGKSSWPKKKHHSSPPFVNVNLVRLTMNFLKSHEISMGRLLTSPIETDVKTIESG